MKRDNIIKKLEKEGYKVHFGKWSYWNVFFVETASSRVYLCNVHAKNNTSWISENFRYQDVIDTIKNADSRTRKRWWSSTNPRIWNDAILYSDGIVNVSVGCWLKS